MDILSIVFWVVLHAPQIIADVKLFLDALHHFSGSDKTQAITEMAGAVGDAAAMVAIATKWQPRVQTGPSPAVAQVPDLVRE